MASPLFLLISVSRRWYVQPDGRLDHTERSIRCGLAALDLVARQHVVHFFLWDAETKSHYAEIGCRGRLPQVTGFLNRALAAGIALPFPTIRGIAIPGSVTAVYPEIIGFLEERNIPHHNPVGGFRRAVAALEKWEQETFWGFDLDIVFNDLVPWAAEHTS